MIPISQIRDNKDDIIQRLSKRGVDYSQNIQTILDLDEKRRKAQTELDSMLAEANQMAKKIGELFKSGQKDEAEQMRTESAERKSAAKEKETEMSELDEALRQALLQVPNVPHASVPAGKTEEDNEEIHREGDIPELSEGALSHWDLAAKYDLIDFELGVKISGAGFPVYKGKGARLQRALINFFLDQAMEAGYNEVLPPILVNEDSGYGTGQLPDKEGQMYHVTGDNLYVIPTAEVPITNIYRDVMLEESELPKKHVGYTPCFRREAGSYGKDVRGLNRLHQFDKVEIVHVAKPEDSYAHLDQMSSYVQGLLKKLELPYRVLRLCGGDLGFAAALTFDMEVYSAAQQRWLEVSSVSNFESFQSNRLKCRFKGASGKGLVHTLNGSALALPRIYAALLENHQTPEGIRIPEALRSYTGFDWIK